MDGPTIAGAAGREGIVMGAGFAAGTTARSIRGGIALGIGIGTGAAGGIGKFGATVTGGSDLRAVSQGSGGDAPRTATAMTAQQTFDARTRPNSRCDFMTQSLLLLMTRGDTGM